MIYVIGGLVFIGVTVLLMHTLIQLNSLEKSVKDLETVFKEHYEGV